MHDVGSRRRFDTLPQVEQVQLAETDQQEIPDTLVLLGTVTTARVLAGKDIWMHFVLAQATTHLLLISNQKHYKSTKSCIKIRITSLALLHLVKKKNRTHAFWRVSTPPFFVVTRLTKCLGVAVQATKERHLIQYSLPTIFLSVRTRNNRITILYQIRA